MDGMIQYSLLSHAACGVTSMNITVTNHLSVSEHVRDVTHMSLRAINARTQSNSNSKFIETD